MFSGICRRNLTGWCGRRSMILVVILEEFRDSLGFFTSSVPKICVMCRNFDEIIGSSILDFLSDFLQFEVHCFRLKGDIIHYI